MPENGLVSAVDVTLREITDRNRESVIALRVAWAFEDGEAVIRLDLRA